MDFRILDEVEVVHDATKLWEDNGLVWVVWMKQRYVKNRGLDEIIPKCSDMQLKGDVGGIIVSFKDVQC